MAISREKRFWLVLAAVVSAGCIVALGGYYLFRESAGSDSPVSGRDQQTAETASLPRMANLPPKKNAVEPPPAPSYQPDAPLLEQARAELRNGIAPEDAVALARALPAGPERADAAFLLLEFAADSGDATAARLVAGYYDPTDETPSGTIRKNPEMAYEWYKKASEGGQDSRVELQRLHRWVETQANQGSKEADLLLKNWR